MADALDGARAGGAENPLGARAARAEAVRKIFAALAPLGDADRDAVLDAVIRLERRDDDEVGPGAASESSEDRRKRLDRERKAAARRGGHSAERPASSADMTADVPRTDAELSADMSAPFRGTSADSPLSLSGSSGICPSPSEPDPDGNVTAVRARAAEVSADTSDPDAEFPMPEGWPLPDDARANAVMAGIRDVEGAWTKFVAHHLESGKLHTRRKWLALFVSKWCVDERNRQGRNGGPARAARGLVQPVPEGGRAWKMGGAE